MNFWLPWVFSAVQGLLSSCGAQASHCSGSSRGMRALGRAGSRAWAEQLWRRAQFFTACAVFPGRASNPCLLHWQVDSHPLGLHWGPSGNRLAHQDLNFPACELGRGHFLCSQLPTRDRPLWDWGWQQPSQGACSRVLGRLRELHCGHSLPCPSCQTPHSTFAEFTGRSPRPCLAAPGCGWARCLRPLPDGPASGQSRHGMGKWLKGLEDT